MKTAMLFGHMIRVATTNKPSVYLVICHENGRLVLRKESENKLDYSRINLKSYVLACTDFHSIRIIKT